MTYEQKTFVGNVMIVGSLVEGFLSFAGNSSVMGMIALGLFFGGVALRTAATMCKD